MTDEPSLFDTDLRIPPMIFPDDTARTRKNSPTTSHAAADSNDTAASRAIVLATFVMRGSLTDNELVAALEHTKVSPSRIRTARHELAEDDVLEFAGYYRLTERKRRAQVWTLKKDAA